MVCYEALEEKNTHPVGHWKGGESGSIAEGSGGGWYDGCA